MAGGPRLEGWLASWCPWPWAGAGGAGPGQHLLIRFTWRPNRLCWRGACSGHCAVCLPVPAAGCCSWRGRIKGAASCGFASAPSSWIPAGACRLKAWCAGPGRLCIRCWGIARRSSPRQGIFSTLAVQRYELLERQTQPLWQWRQQLAARLQASAGPRHGALLAALVMGRAMAPLPDAITSSFRAAGLSHALAASGFHLSVLLGVVLAITRRAPRLMRVLCRRWCVGAVCAAGRAAAVGAQGGVDGGHGAADSRIR